MIHPPYPTPENGSRPALATCAQGGLALGLALPDSLRPTLALLSPRLSVVTAASPLARLTASPCHRDLTIYPYLV